MASEPVVVGLTVYLLEEELQELHAWAQGMNEAVEYAVVHAALAAARADPLSRWFSPARYWENLRRWCAESSMKKAEPPEKSNQ